MASGYHILLLVAITVVSAAICHYIAKSRGAKPVFWGMMGVLFGPFAIPFVFLSKKSQK